MLSACFCDCSLLHTRAGPAHLLAHAVGTCFGPVAGLLLIFAVVVYGAQLLLPVHPWAGHASCDAGETPTSGFARLRYTGFVQDSLGAITSSTLSCLVTTLTVVSGGRQVSPWPVLLQYIAREQASTPCHWCISTQRVASAKVSFSCSRWGQQRQAGFVIPLRVLTVTQLCCGSHQLFILQDFLPELNAAAF